MRDTSKLNRFFSKNFNLITSLSLVVMLISAIVFTSIAIFSVNTKATGTLRFKGGIEANVKNLTTKEVNLTSANLSLMVSGYNKEKFDSPKALDSSTFYNVNHNDVLYIANPVISPAKNTKPYFLRAKWQIKVGNVEYDIKDLEKINIYSLPEFNTLYWTQGDDGYYYNTLYDNSQFLQDATDLNKNQNDKDNISRDIIFFNDLNSTIVISDFNSYNYNLNDKINISLLIELIEANESFAQTEWSLIRSLENLDIKDCVLINDSVFQLYTKFLIENFGGNSEGENDFFDGPSISNETISLIYLLSQIGFNENCLIDIPYEELKNPTSNYNPTDNQSELFNQLMPIIKSNYSKSGSFSLLGLNNNKKELYFKNNYKTNDLDFLNYQARICIYLLCDGLIYPNNLITSLNNEIEIKLSTLKNINNNIENIVLADNIELGDALFSTDKAYYAFYVFLMLTGQNVDINGFLEIVNSNTSIEQINETYGAKYFERNIECIKQILFSMRGNLNGEMDFSEFSISLIRNLKYYKSKLKNIKFNHTITKIPISCFAGCDNLRKLIIPSNVNYFSESCITNCNNLERLEFYDDFTNKSFENYAIGVLPSLKFLVMPRNANIVSDSGSSGAGGMQSIFYAFQLNESFESIEYIYINSDSGIINSNEEILKNVLSNELSKNPLIKKIDISSRNSLFSSLDGVVYTKNFENLIAVPVNYEKEIFEIPYGVKVIEKGVFKGVKNIKSIKIPSSVEVIYEEAFSSTSIENIIFEGNSNLKEFAFESNSGIGPFSNSNITSLEIPIDNYMVGTNNNNLYNNLIIKNCSKLSKLTFKSSNVNNFYKDNEKNDRSTSVYIEECPLLEELIFPENMYINAYINNCNSLKKINTKCTGISFKNIPNIEEFIYDGDFSSIGLNNFSNLKKLKKVKLPKGITEIPSCSFADCINLVEVDLQSSITKIGSYAFFNCKSLVINKIPENCVFVGENAFYNCKSVVEFNLPTTTYESCEEFTLGSDYYDEDRFALISCKKYVIVGTPQNSYSGSYSVDSNGILYNADKTLLIRVPDKIELTKFEIPSTVNSIYRYAFNNCVNITEVVLPNTLNSIEYLTFVNCVNLEKVIINNLEIDIKDCAFLKCNKLSNVVFSQNIYLGINISNNAFVGCDSFTSDNVASLVQPNLNELSSVYLQNLTFEDFLAFLMYEKSTMLNLIKVKIDRNGSSSISYRGKDDIDYTVIQTGYSGNIDYNCYKKMKENFPNLTNIEVEVTEYQITGDDKVGQYTEVQTILVENSVWYFVKNKTYDSGNVETFKSLIFYPFFKSETAFTVGADVNLILPDCGLFYNDYINEISVDSSNSTYFSINNIIYSKPTSVIDLISSVGVPDYALDYIKTNRTTMFERTEYFNKVMVLIPRFITNINIDCGYKDVYYEIYVDSYVESINLTNSILNTIVFLNYKNSKNTNLEYYRNKYKKNENNIEFFNSTLNLKYITSTNSTVIMMCYESDAELFSDVYIYNNKQDGQLDYSSYVNYLYSGNCILEANQYVYLDYYKNYIPEVTYYNK